MRYLFVLLLLVIIQSSGAVEGAGRRWARGGGGVSSISAPSITMGFNNFANGGFTLSNGSAPNWLTATGPSTPGNMTVLAIPGHNGTACTASPCKYYFEATVTSKDSNNGWGISLGNGGGTTSNTFGVSITNSYANYGGFDTNSYDFEAGGTYRTNNSSPGSWRSAAVTTGDVIAVTVDTTNKLAWVRDVTQGDGWNPAQGGTQNPATGQGGIALTTLTATPVMVMFSSAGSGFTTADTATFNFGASAFAGSIPGGTAAWGTSPAQVYSPVTGSYALVLDDEFNGSTLDTTTNWTYQSGTHGSTTMASANNAVTNGFLRQSITNSSAPTACTTAICNGAFIGSKATFVLGYFEARQKFPGPCGSAPGTVPSFWMNNAGNFPEFDVPEYRGTWCAQGNWADASQYNDNPTWFGANENDPNRYFGDMGNAFHIHSVLWTASQIIFYVDGIPTAVLVNGTNYTGVTNSTTPTGTLAINSTTSANVLIWNIANITAGNTTSSTVFPSIYYVDYVHVYQSGGSAVSPQTNYGGPGDFTGSGNSP